MLRSRRLIAALLSASMIFTVLPSAVFADDETTEPDAVVEQQEEAEEEQVPDEIPEEPEEVPAEEPDAAPGEDGDTDTGEIAFPDAAKCPVCGRKKRDQEASRNRDGAFRSFYSGRAFQGGFSASS